MCVCRQNEEKPKSTYQTPAGLAGLFGQVDEVKDTMNRNMVAIQERGEKLEQLDNTAREMLGNAEQLSKAAGKKKKK